MIADLAPYPAMKDSGVPWLGEVPEHWGIERLKARAANIIEQTDERPIGGLYVALEHVEGWTGRLRDAGSEISFESQVKRFRPDDVLFGKLRPYLAKVARPTREGVCVGEFFVLRSRANGVGADYLAQLLRSKPIIDAIDASTFGAKMPRADWHFVGNLALSFPPLPEQAAIVRFLDHADRRIRRYIHAKQKLIKLLEEQKQAIIHRGVTRGLDPNARLKPSGIEWLGEVPEHWEVKRLKQVATIQTGITLGKTYREAKLVERPYLRVANVQAGRLDLAKITRVRVPAVEADGATLRAGDVLMTEGGDIDKLGRGCVWHDEIAGCLHQNHVFAVRPVPSVLLPEFLVAIMGSPHGRRYFQLTAKQTTNLAATNSTTLGNFPVRLPPVCEQQQILKDIAENTGDLHQAIDRAHRGIALLREYRTRLIADVVTGKVDVRAAAASLPGEADEPESLDDSEELAEGDEDNADGDPDAAPEEAEA